MLAALLRSIRTTASKKSFPESCERWTVVPDFCNSAFRLFIGVEPDSHPLSDIFRKDVFKQAVPAVNIQNG